MSKAAVFCEILEPMQRLFAPPRATMNDAEKTAALGEYAESLEHFSDDALRAGWRTAREAHLRGTWPPLALILLHCRQATPKTPALTFHQQRAEEDRMFNRFCEHQGIPPEVMRRPTLWWLRFRDEWEPHWLETEVPKGQKPNMRTRAETAGAT